MFERFTEPARAVLVEAQDVARELGSHHLGVGHLLYGCAAVRDDTAGAPLRDAGITAAAVRRLLPRVDSTGDVPIDPDALGSIGIDYDQVRAAAEETFGTGALDRAPDRRTQEGRLRKPPFTPEAKQVLENALRVAVELHHRRMTPGHLLLGVLRLDDDFVASFVERSGGSVDALRASVLARLASAA